MTEQEREELIEQMARRIDAFIKDTTDWRKVLAVEIAKNLCIDKKDFDTLEWGAKDYFLTQARAALAVAEPVIREQCARIATAIREANADTGFEKSDFLDGIAFGAKVIAKAIR